MSYPAYSEMKASGVEWLGDVPKHWKVKRLKASLSSAKNGIWGDDPAGDENDIVCVRVADFNRNTLTVGMEKFTMRNVSHSEQRGRLLRRGDLLLEKSGGGELQPVGFVVLYNHETMAVCSNFVARLELNKSIDARYFNYCHSAAYAVRLNTRSIKQTTGIQNLDADAYFNERFPFPEITEQQQIAAFLDRKTAELDAVIRLKERQLELLAEKRQALISQAVTRGLDPNAPLKPSGIPWLGDVPEHWEVNKICWLFGLIGSGTTPASSNENYYDGDFPWVNTGELNDGVITETKKSVTEEAINTLSALTVFPAGTLLIALYGATIGKLGILNISATTNQACCALGNPIGIKTKFMFYWFLGNRQHIIAMAYGGGQPNISQELVKQLRFAVPPLPEQQAIVAYLDTETARMEGVGAAIKTQIETLREYRQALVSAAVTGKIDVRGEP
jgi:type I restriction enzyme S subunit